MSKTLINVDDELLVECGRLLGTKTKKDTVNGALRDVVRRASALRFQQLVADGAFNDPAQVVGQ